MERNSKTILVVEDFLALRAVIQDVLVSDGYKVEAASNGEQALAVLGKGLVPDLILLDLRMPVMNGSTFLGVLRKNPAWASIPVAILSGKGEMDVNLEAAGFLEKPVQADALKGLVRKLIQAS